MPADSPDGPPAVLLATCAKFPGGDEDAHLLDAALHRAGIPARWAVWTDPHVDWDAATVVLRSTWDYQGQRQRFLDWTARVPRLRNVAEVVAWNTDKAYLRDLAAAGVPTVPTAFAGPGAAFRVPDGVDEHAEIVVKPTVGAGSRGAGRFAAARRDDAARHAAALHAAGRTVAVQPYLDSVDTAGETALLYLGGRFSHAIRKGPMLPPGATHPVNAYELFVQEEVTARAPEPDELEVGAAALQFLRDRFGADQLYARVDLLRAPDGPVLTELELTEPSLFLTHADGAADTFATAIADVLAA